MSWGLGAAITVGCLVVAVAVIYIWKIVPVFSCPKCGSMNVVAVRGWDAEKCEDCQHEWSAR